MTTAPSSKEYLRLGWVVTQESILVVVVVIVISGPGTLHLQVFEGWYSEVLEDLQFYDISVAIRTTYYKKNIQIKSNNILFYVGI